MSSESPTPCDCKIGHGIQKYGVETLYEEITRRSTEEEHSLRELEAFINREFAESAVVNAQTSSNGTTRVSVSPNEVVRILNSDDDVTLREKARLETQLEQVGIEADELASDFISYRLVKNHLNDCVDVDTSRDKTSTIDSVRKTVEWARSRCEGVILKNLTALSNANRISAGDIDVTVTPRVTCDDCGASMLVTEFLSKNGCNCVDGSNLISNPNASSTESESVSVMTDTMPDPDGKQSILDYAGDGDTDSAGQDSDDEPAENRD